MPHRVPWGWSCQLELSGPPGWAPPRLPPPPPFLLKKSVAWDPASHALLPGEPPLTPLVTRPETAAPPSAPTPESGCLPTCSCHTHNEIGLGCRTFVGVYGAPQDNAVKLLIGSGANITRPLPLLSSTAETEGEEPGGDGEGAGRRAWGFQCKSGNKEGALGGGGGRRRLGPCWFERAGSPRLTQSPAHLWACWSLRLVTNATSRELPEKEGEERGAQGCRGQAGSHLGAGPG